jgi:hypothetical protein
MDAAVLTDQSPPYVVQSTVPDSPTPDEQPTYHPFITRSNAVELGRKSGEARRAKREQAKTTTRNILPSKPADAPTIAQALYLSDKEREGLVHAYKALCKASRENLATLKDPKDRHQEASTLAKLEAALWRYAGIPGEGTLKPSQPKERGRGAPVEPREPPK